MKDRINEIIQKENLNAITFSKLTGICRAKLSHVRSGRSNLSVNSIVKILETFPSINPCWLLSGSGSMYLEAGKSLSVSGQSQTTIRDRILEIMQNKNLNTSMFSKLTGLPHSFLSHLRDRYPNTDHIIKILNAFRSINPIWFLSGDGPMYLESGKTNDQCSLDVFFNYICVFKPINKLSNPHR